MKSLNERYDIIRPAPESLLQSARSFGYSVETAIADLIDNSVTAGASRISISFGIDRYSSYVRIEDNGKGMNEKALINAMKIGSLSPLADRKENDLGRFGLGLKTASFSQCKRLTVKSQTRSGREFIRCWDLDLVAKEKEWVLLRTCADKSSEKYISSIASKASGTIVLWEKLDRLVESGEITTDKEHFYRKFANVRKHLGLIFHRFIEDGDIAISVQGEAVEAINPFNISETIPSRELDEEYLSIREQPILIQPYILPHESNLTDDEKKQLQIIKGWTDHQGIYLYRNRRLISDGTWLDLDFRKKESQRLCRIKIDIPNTLDKEWQIDVKKASAKIPDVLRKRIRAICFSALEKAIKVYTQRGAYIRRKGEKKEIVYLWNAKQKHGHKTYQINEKHPLYELIYRYLGTQGKIFRDYVRLVAEAIPLNLIVNDFSDTQTILETPYHQYPQELKKIYNAAKDALMNSGVSENEATKVLNSMDIFQKTGNLI